MNKDFGFKFGGGLALGLLALYISTIFYIISQVYSCGACGTVQISSGVTFVVTTVGGLVSALVLARLAITSPGESPAEISSAKSGSLKNWAENLTLWYIIAWFITGFSALIFGTMLFPNISSTLSDIGTGWLGLAVTSVYAYFGLDPKSSNS
jgi:hypothetical protein